MTGGELVGLVSLQNQSVHISAPARKLHNWQLRLTVDIWMDGRTDGPFCCRHVWCVLQQ